MRYIYYCPEFRVFLNFTKDDGITQISRHSSYKGKIYHNYEKLNDSILYDIQTLNKIMDHILSDTGNFLDIERDFILLNEDEALLADMIDS